MDIKDIYAGCIDTSKLNPQHDLEDAVTCLVVQFVMRNRFEANIDALDNVTPAQWRYQVQNAAEDLTRRLQETFDTIECDLHTGNYHDQRVK
jgi:hypothetical protein